MAPAGPRPRAIGNRRRPPTSSSRLTRSLVSGRPGSSRTAAPTGRPLPHAWQSPAWQAEVGTVREAVGLRTPEQAAAVNFWAGGPGTVTPAGLWVQIARDLIVRDGLDLPHAARVLALTSVAHRRRLRLLLGRQYAYWSERPITADPSLDGFDPDASVSVVYVWALHDLGGGGGDIGHLFPTDAADLAARAQEAAASRLRAGIHFAIDNEIGAAGGGMVGRLASERARTDGAEQQPG